MMQEKEILIREIIEKGLLLIAPDTDENTWIILKNRSRTPIFLDTQQFHSYPALTKKICLYAINHIIGDKIKYDRIMGLPYGGLIFGYGISALTERPAISIRKEGKKDYDDAGDILGLHHQGETILLTEDATVTGQTAIGFARTLRERGMNVTDVITCLDVDQGAEENLKCENITLHHLFKRKHIYEILCNEYPEHIYPGLKPVLDRFIYG